MFNTFFETKYDIEEELCVIQSLLCHTHEGVNFGTRCICLYVCNTLRSLLLITHISHSFS